MVSVTETPPMLSVASTESEGAHDNAQSCVAVTAPSLQAIVIVPVYVVPKYAAQIPLSVDCDEMVATGETSTSLWLVLVITEMLVLASAEQAALQS